MHTRSIPLTRPTLTKDMEEAVINVLNNEKLVDGESVYKFEEEFAQYIGTDYAIAVNSGSSALLLTFYAFNIKGERFIAPSATFIATLNGPTLLGGIPIFSEIGNDYTISVESASSLYRKYGAKYVIPVHLYGQPADIDGIKEFCKDVIIVEDAAQAHGALYKGRRVGSLGDATIFSFYPTKNMTVCGDGGMVTTSNEKIYRIVKKMRDVGRRSKYIHDEIGYTMRLNTINAAIGRVQLKYLDQWNERRRIIAKRYIDKLKYINEIILPPLQDSSRLPVYHMFVIKTKYRNELGAWLMLNGVQTGIHYPIPVHKQPSYSPYKPVVDLSFTEEWSKSILSLPIYPTLSEEDHTYVIELIERFYNDKLYQQKEIRVATEKWVSGLI